MQAVPLFGWRLLWDRLPGVLVVEPDRKIVPVCYGFERAFRVGSLDDLVRGDGETVRREMVRVASALQEVGSRLLRALHDDPEWTVLNPSEAMARHASAHKAAG